MPGAGIPDSYLLLRANKRQGISRAQKLIRFGKRKARPNMLRAFCVASLLLALSSGTFAQDHSGEIPITLERIRGYGSQPVYKMAIRGDGSVNLRR